MLRNIGKALTDFEAALEGFRSALASEPALSEHLFEGSREWRDLLVYKLVPHLAGAGCLVATVAGGTNTGKSTVFNLLVGAPISPVIGTAAATRHPILAANRYRREQCLEGKLVPEFDPRCFDNLDDAVSREVSEDVLLVAAADSLPDHLVVMDTPDVDSIDQENWEVADHLRAAGDVLIAVVTGEKYKDERVVGFFREALASGRVVLPLMNKANPENDYHVARKQLDEFCADVGLSGPRFVVPHDFELARNLGRPIDALGSGPDLRRFLETCDVKAIKERVFSGTVRHFADEAGLFLDRLERMRDDVADLLAKIESKTREFALKYDPAPGAAVGGLFHEFVQAKRGPVRRAIGRSSAAVVRGISSVGNTLAAAVRKRATLDASEPANPESLNAFHRRAIERIVHDLASNYYEIGRTAAEPLRGLILKDLETLDADAAALETARATLRSENISDEFRQHAMNLLNKWWDDHKGRRRVLEALDAMLAVMPAAIAAPIAVYTGGIGASEAAIVIGPFVMQFVTRVMEFQFGDAMFDFLSPWKRDQQENLRASLHNHVTEPGAKGLCAVLELLDGETSAELRRCWNLCQRA